jgi:hypothetical protein
MIHNKPSWQPVAQRHRASDRSTPPSTKGCEGSPHRPGAPENNSRAKRPATTTPPRGYNEIHPIKFCSPIGKWDCGWPANLNDLETFWATALGDAISTTTIELQKQPQNQWQVHPILDGCDPVVIV